MSATSVRQDGYPAGVALYGTMFAIGLLVILPLAIVLFTLPLGKDAPPGFILTGVAAVVAAVAYCVMTATAISFQARPVSLAPVNGLLIWRPTLVWRVAVVVIALSLAGMFIAIATTDAPANVLLPLAVLALGIGIVAARLLVARFEADAWGIRCTNPTTTVRIPWGDVQSLEPRGESVLAQRIIVVTKQRRARMLWTFDPRVPVCRDTGRLLVAELEAVRRSAAGPGT